MFWVQRIFAIAHIAQSSMMYWQGIYICILYFMLIDNMFYPVNVSVFLKFNVFSPFEVLLAFNFNFFMIILVYYYMYTTVTVDNGGIRLF